VGVDAGRIEELERKNTVELDSATRSAMGMPGSQLIKASRRH
jgi:hypothetical protein